MTMGNERYVMLDDDQIDRIAQRVLSLLDLPSVEDRFAMAASTGFLAKSEYEWEPTPLAEVSFTIAREMMRERRR